MMIRMKDIVRPTRLSFTRLKKRRTGAVQKYGEAWFPGDLYGIGYGPTFGGGHDIHIANNAGHNAHSYTNFGHSFLAPSEVKEKVTVLTGTYYFTPDEVEVFYLP